METMVRHKTRRSKASRFIFPLHRDRNYLGPVHDQVSDPFFLLFQFWALAVAKTSNNARITDA